MNLHQLCVAFYTIYSKEVKRFVRIWVQTLLPPVITMVLYFFIFGSLIGERIGTMGGEKYIVYIAPGLVMMSVITNSFANVVSSFFSTKFQGSIQELMVSPTPVLVIILGYCLGGMTRGLIVGVLVTLVSFIFTDLPIMHPGIVALVFVMTTLVFTLVGLVNAVFAKKFDDVTIVTTFVLTPLTYMGGVFYSVDLLSEPWRSLSFINPVLYMVNAFRYGFLGVSDVPLSMSFFMLSCAAILLFTLVYYLLKTGKGTRS